MEQRALTGKPTALPGAASRLQASVPAVVVGLLLVDSLHFVFARALGAYLPPVTSVLYVLGIGTLEVAAFAWARGRFRWSTLRRNAPFFLAIGFLIAVSTTINYTAVAYIAPGTASLLSQTSILFGLGYGLLWLRDRLSTAQWLGALAALVGVGIITFQPGDYLRLGSALVIASNALYALHAAIVKRYGGELEFVEFFLWRLIATTGFLLLSAAGQGMLIWPSGPAWLLLILTGTVDVVVSRTLYYVALRRLRISIHSLALTLSPVVAVLWSLALFGIRPTPREMIGGLAVLAGMAVVSMRRR